MWWDQDKYPTFEEFAEENETYGLTEEGSSRAGGYEWDFSF